MADFAAMPAELRSAALGSLEGAQGALQRHHHQQHGQRDGPRTWATFDQAQTAYEEGGYSGVGFVLNGDGIVGVGSTSA